MQNTEVAELNNVPSLKISLKKPRNATFELVRIIAMILIIAVHFRGHGNWYYVEGVNSVFMQLGRALFTPSVNVFVMISAYFMCTKDEMKIHWKKLGKIWLTVFFYSIFLFAIFTGMGVYDFDAITLLSSLFPIVFTKYWFVSAYFLMMIASPFLNAIIARLNKAQFSALFIAIVIIAAVQDLGLFSTIQLGNGGNGIWFCLLYLLAAYIRKFDIRLNKIAWIICSVVFIGIVLFITFVWTGPSHTSLVGVYMSIYILLATKTVKITNAKFSKAICFISSLTFGIYLIHDSNEMRGFMYESIFHSSEFIPSKYAFLIYMGFVLVTFAVCAVAEYIRQLGFRGCAILIRRILGEKSDALQTRIKSFIARTADKINGSDKNLLINE